ncbi:MAG TPA: response regulator transcription factor [Mucilaginibacter sp.]|nr:response regulator transcription factor [Mucilaginibacter sp.]
MKKIGCLVVDDEPIARDILKTYIERLPELSLLGDCKNATEAYQALYDFPVDVIFLDVQMPVITGTTFLRSLHKPPLIIFTTAYPQYAVEGFELNSVDYLLKPITFERFCQGIQKVKDRMDGHSLSVVAKGKVPYIFIKQDSKLVKVDFDDLCYIQAERDFCSLYLVNGTRLLAGMHLKMLEDILPSEKFVRVHRSYIVSIDKIRIIKGNIVETDNAEIPIGNNYREGLFKVIRIG